MKIKNKKLYLAFSNDALGLYVVFAENKPDAALLVQEEFGLTINNGYNKIGAFGYKRIVTSNILEFIANTHRIQHNGITTTSE
jgi:hypothetical protein